MNREIKFRGKTVENKWVYGNLLITKDLTFICKAISKLKTRNYNIENLETIGQYTGLKDKNGVEIYEGDIVQQFNVKANGIIKYKYGQFGIVCFNMFWNIHPTKLEVIGNIHDNPELLEGE